MTEHSSVEDVLQFQRDVLGELMRSEALARGDADSALAQATEAAARLLTVRRASVWMFDDARTKIDCADLYDDEAALHTRGMKLFAADAPAYFAAAVGERCIVAHDARTDPRTSEFADSYLAPLGITSMLDAPVFMHGRLVGVVCHEHVGPPRLWQPREELLAGTLADFVGMALSAADHASQATELRSLRDGLEQLVAERTRELAESRENVRILFETSPVALVVTKLRSNTVAQTNVRAADLFEVPRESAAGRHSPEFWAHNEDRLRLMELIRDRHYIEGYEAELKTLTGRPFWASISARALVLDGEPALLTSVQDITEKKQAEERLREMATLDGLTGIYNRRHFYELAQPIIDLAERHGRKVCAAMIDVDHFKTINDRHGHWVGDEALRMLAGICGAHLRTSDILARYGGEEFVVLLPETDTAGARIVMERIRAALRIGPLRTPDGEVIPLTVSIGVAARVAQQDLTSLLRVADEAMYAAKRSGRDRIEVSGS